MGRGINSLLITVDSMGDVAVHGSQKGQLFLKENADIVDRFAKICSGELKNCFSAFLSID